MRRATGSISARYAGAPLTTSHIRDDPSGIRAVAPPAVVVAVSGI
ncbi:hypothetical protein ACTWPT_54175 [Nonomuraea sp. 3N208]